MKMDVKDLKQFEGPQQDRIRYVLLNYLENNSMQAFTTRELFQKLKIGTDFSMTLSALKKQLLLLQKENRIQRTRTFSKHYWHLKV